MDPKLREAVLEAAPERELEVILKLRDADKPPAKVRIIARFGDVVTARVASQEVRAVWEDPAVLSVKAPRLVLPGDEIDLSDESDDAPLAIPAVRGDTSGATGRGVIVASLDWGLDVTHPSFRHADGRTRVRAFWHQGISNAGDPASPYGYGRIFTRDDIDAALRTSNPFEVLGYHPAQSDPGDRSGTHGTHVLDIAAGSGFVPHSLRGFASDAELIFVHLATGSLEPLASLGDTVRILEALDFVRVTAGSTRWVVNMSLGRHGGPHNGRTLVEQGIDHLLIEAPGRAIVQSCGNYFSAKAASSGLVRSGGTRTLHWETSPADRTPNELEIWYSGKDTLGLRIDAPDGSGSWRVDLGHDAPIVVGGRRVGHAYHRAFDPAAGDHHVDIFLQPGAPAGMWTVSLSARDVVDGRYFAWVERDAACPDCQSHLSQRDVVRRFTTGTLANGFRSIVVGAYSAGTPRRLLPPFSSAGPTRDGRSKPDLVAPGVAIRAARSAARSGSAPLLTDKSGTSMAAPHVTGVIACMFEAAKRPLAIHETRNLLLGSVDSAMGFGIDAQRLGAGYLNPTRAVASAAQGSLIQEQDSMKENDEALCAECAQKESDEMDDSASEERSSFNFVLLSGGPGPFDTRDVEHDKSWANYVDPPLLMATQKPFWNENERVWWFIYKPPYEERWTRDTASNATPMQRDHVARVRSKGFSSYVDLLEHRAKDRGWDLRWVDSGADVYRRLKTFSRGSISRVWYWGHARDALWLTVDHDAAGRALEPADTAVMKAADIDATVARLFAPASDRRRSRFIGCNTNAYAEEFAKRLKTVTEGVIGKIDFGTVHTSGGDPCLVGGAVVTGFNARGVALSSSEVSTMWGVCGGAGAVAPEVDEQYPETDEATDPTDVELHDGSFEPSEALVEQAELFAHAARRDGGLRESGSALPLDWLRGGHELVAFVRDALRDEGSPRFLLVGRAGAPLSHGVRSGDILVRVAGGEKSLSSAAIVADPLLLAPDGARARGWNMERGGDGLYALIIERGLRPHCRHDRFARRVVDRRGRMPPGQFLLRARADSGIETTSMASLSPLLAEAGSTVTLRVQNRLVRHDTIARCRVALTGTTVTATTGTSGTAVLDLSGVADGTYDLVIESPDVLPISTRVGPGLGTRGATPPRVWRAFAASVTVRGERIVSSTSPDLQTSGSLVAKVQPVWMRSPNQSARGAASVSHIVVHHTAGPVIGPALNTFLEASEQRSAHYVIDTDGQIVKMVHDDAQSWHAGGSQWEGHEQVNGFSIGIEIVNRSGAYPAAQYSALIQLLQDLRSAYPAIAAHHIVGHSDIATTRDAPRRLGRKSGDPGLAFEWEQLERAGLGLIRPATTPADLGLGGYFTLRPTGRLKVDDRDSSRTYGGRVEATLPNTIVAELQQKLRCIGYFCPDHGRYDRATEAAVTMFQEHFCSATRPRPARDGQVDETTAAALAAVLSQLTCATSSEAATPEVVLGQPNLAFVFDTLRAPFRWIGRLVIRYNLRSLDGKQHGTAKGFGTATLIGNQHILTAAHNLRTFDPAKKYFLDAVSMQFFAATDDTDPPLIPAVEVDLASAGIPPDWNPRARAARDGSEDCGGVTTTSPWDYAVLRLREPLGSKHPRRRSPGDDRDDVGFWGAAGSGGKATIERVPPETLVSTDVSVAGYASPDEGANVPVFAGGRLGALRSSGTATVPAELIRGGAVFEQRLLHTADTLEGQSGAPIWIERQKQFVLVGIHTGSTITPLDARINLGVRITQRVIDDIARWTGAGAARAESLPESDDSLAPEQAAPIDWCAIGARLAALAHAEEAAWTAPNGNKLLENNPAQRSRLIQYWQAVPGFAPLAAATTAANQSAADARAWSAAFVCFVMQQAGITAADGFEFSDRHLSYIVGALRNRESSDRNRHFWLVDRTELAHEAAPQPGDLICFNRPDENGVWSNHTYEILRAAFWPNIPAAGVTGRSHCAIVAGTTVVGGRRFLQTIGGNEDQSVRLRANIPLDADGHIILNVATTRSIFGMIKIIGCNA